MSRVISKTSSSKKNADGSITVTERTVTAEKKRLANYEGGETEVVKLEKGGDKMYIDVVKSRDEFAVFLDDDNEDKERFPIEFLKPRSLEKIVSLSGISDKKLISYLLFASYSFDEIEEFKEMTRVYNIEGKVSQSHKEFLAKEKKEKPKDYRALLGTFSAVLPNTINKYNYKKSYFATFPYSYKPKKIDRKYPNLDLVEEEMNSIRYRGRGKLGNDNSQIKYKTRAKKVIEREITYYQDELSGDETEYESVLIKKEKKPTRLCCYCFYFWTD